MRGLKSPSNYVNYEPGVAAALTQSRVYVVNVLSEEMTENIDLWGDIEWSSHGNC